MPTGVKVLLWVVFAIILLSILRVNKSNTVTTKPELTKEEYIAQCIDVDYEAVARHPNDFKGEKITFSGKVVQVSEGSYVTLRINQGGDYDATWYVRYTPTENEGRILENDTIVVYGECTGTKTYTAVLGNNVTIPSMSMMYYTIDGK